MDSTICTVRDSPLPNRLNEIKGRSNIRYDSVVSTKLSHKSLMLSFVELLAFDPVRNCRKIPLAYRYDVGALDYGRCLTKSIKK